MKADITLDFHYSSPIEKVWRALTSSKILAEWIWENDFQPIGGQRFQFRTKPKEYWDGIVTGEVLEVKEPNKLSYMWASAGETTTVTWTLEENADGTHLYFEQAGFSEETRTYPGAMEGAKSSWQEFGHQLEKVLEHSS